MLAVQADMLGLLQKSPQFIIPIYQRTYSWTETQCAQLWKDILRAGNNDNILAHFIGSVVYIEQAANQITKRAPVLVIDGQQRLTTVMLIIEALARRVGDTEPLEGFSAVKLRHYYLLNNLEHGEKRFKLLLPQTDRDTLLAIVEDRQIPNQHSLRLVENFKFFEQRIEEMGDNFIPLCKGLEKLMIVDVSLHREYDNPQLIFESMNSTGLELSQADLIRNFILMGLEAHYQEKMYTEYWRPMELAFGQEAYSKHFDGFMRHYLTVKTGSISRIGQVYDSFKSYAEGEEVDTLLADLHKFANHYCILAFGGNIDQTLAAALHNLRSLDVDVAYPLLLELYDDYSAGRLSLNGLIEAINLVESYVFRRAVCGLATNSLNKTFASFSQSLHKDQYRESILAHFRWLPSYRRFPSDEEFQRELQTRDLYNFRLRSYWLRRIENHDRKEYVPTDEYTVEHVLPQNKDLSQEWQDALGDNWREIQDALLHTLGNLTLTGYNAEYSDRPFAEKRDMRGGFRESPLRLNEGLAEIGSWNEEAIRDRAKRLANKAVSVWKRPTPSSEALRAHVAQAEDRRRDDTIENNLNFGERDAIRCLYMAFRMEVMALDSGISEEPFNHQIIYRVETNFVSLEPQEQQLRLLLNMPFTEVQDPRDIAEHVAIEDELGSWGVRVHLRSQEDLPYVMGLVRQAFEKQIGITESEG